MSLKNKSVLVTGGAGFIGSHLVDRLVKEEPENLIVVDNITVTKANSPPVADPNGPYTGMEVVPVHFSGSGSHDLDGSIVSYLWTFGDGNNATGATPTHTYTQNVVTLKMHDTGCRRRLTSIVAIEEK